MANSRRKTIIAKALKRKKGPAEDSPFYAPWSQGNKRHGKKRRRSTLIPTKMPYDKG